MKIHRPALTEMLAALGVSIAVPALAQAKTIEVTMGIERKKQKATKAR